MSKPRVLSNDDGWILSSFGPPITVDEIRDNMVGPFAGSAIDTFLWSVGGREVFSYETDIGERIGQGVGAFENGAFENEETATRVANLRHLVAEHGGPVSVIARLCREAGVRFLPSLRMNTHYNTEETSFSFGSFRRDNPHLLIGRPGEKIPEFGELWGLRTGKDFAHSRVREFMASIALELIERFDVDGVELDFMRHPGIFRPEEAVANRQLLTDMVRVIRVRMDEISRERGRPLELAVRVAPTLSDSLRLGMDAECWIREGLADIVIAGLGFNPFEARVAEFVAAAAGTNCQILGCFEGLRPVMDPEVLRAIAARYLDAGADGLYFFNFYSMSAQWKTQQVGELIDAAALARGDKIYEIDCRRGGSPKAQIHHSFRHCLPPEQLPVRLHPTHAGPGAALHFEIVDDLETATSEGGLKACRLRLGFEELGDDDALDLSLNGQPLSWNSQQTPNPPWTRLAYDASWNLYPSRCVEVAIDGVQLEFALTCPPLRQGRNELTLRSRGDGHRAPLLQYVAVELSYGD